MTYEIIYSKNARKDVKKLDPIVRKKIAKHIERFSKNPLLYAHKLVTFKIGQYRWRAGNYRIIFDITDKRIEILRVGHRREIYRK